VVDEPQTVWEGPSAPLPTLSVDHLHKKYRDLVAVADISFKVLPGQIYGLLGPNGAGKSTTIHCITGVVTPSNGSIEIRGHRADSIEAKNMLGFVPDELIGDDPESVKRGLKQAFSGLLARDFNNLLFAHGDPLAGGGKEALRKFAASEG